MTKRVMSIVLTLIFSITSPFSVSAYGQEAYNIRAVYLGINGYGTGAAAFNNPAAWRFNFAVGDRVVQLRIDTSNSFYINKQMAQGYVFDLTIRDGMVIAASEPEADVKGTVSSRDASGLIVDGVTVNTNESTEFYEIINRAGGSTVRAITADDVVGRTVKVYGNLVYQAFVARPFEPPVRGTPGLRTIRNLIATSLEPAGTTLYIFGGSWSWAGNAAAALVNYDYNNPSVPPDPNRPIIPPWEAHTSHQSRTIGLSQRWVNFFQEQDANFTYRIGLADSRSDSFYPPFLNINNNPPNTGGGRGILNEYNYAGVDCSGYMGWVIYNTLQSVSGGPGYVHFAARQASDMAHRGYGSHTRSFTSPSFEGSSFKPGDIFSMTGHVWIVVGVCEDGSILIMHSTPSNSRTGQPGGGVQLTGIRASSGPGSLPNSQAHRLAVEYMERYFPEWSRRYSPAEMTFGSYANLGWGADSAFTGKFSWHRGTNGLLDPDGYVNMTADQILRDLFNENPSVYVNGIEIEFDRPMIVENGCTLVPIRTIAEAMGASANWDEAAQSTTISRDGIDVIMQVGNQTVNVNDSTITLEVPPRNIGGRILVPARVLAETFGADVQWNAENNSIIITIQ